MIKTQKYYFKWGFTQEANEKLKQIKKKTEFKLIYDKTWAKNIQQIWWEIYFYNENQFVKEIIANLEMYILLERKISINELLISSTDEDIQFRNNYHINPYEYLIEIIKLPQYHTSERIAPQIVKLRSETGNLLLKKVISGSEKNSIKDIAPFLIREEYYGDEHFTEYYLYTKDTNKASMEIMQRFISIFEKTQNEVENWLRRKNYDIGDIIEIKHNIPYLESHEICEHSFSIPKDNYIIRIEKLEKTDEIIKEKRVKKRFYSSIDNAWQSSFTKLRDFIELEDEKLYKILDYQVMSIYGKPFSEFSNENLSDKWFQEYFKLSPKSRMKETYTFCNTSDTNMGIIPQVVIFRHTWEKPLFEYLISTTDNSDEILSIMKQFLYVLSVKIKNTTDWLREKELKIEKMISIKTNLEPKEENASNDYKIKYGNLFVGRLKEEIPNTKITLEDLVKAIRMNQAISKELTLSLPQAKVAIYYGLPRNQDIIAEAVAKKMQTLNIKYDYKKTYLLLWEIAKEGLIDFRQFDGDDYRKYTIWQFF